MGAVDTAFKAAFRDYNTDGVPSSGVKKPAKSEIRALGATIENYVAAPWTLSANITITTPPTAPAGYVAQFIGASANGNQFVLMDGYGGIPGFRTRRANVSGSAASAVQNADVISTVDAYGYGATGFSSGARAQIRAVATQAWTDTAQGCKWVIATTADGGTTLTDRVTIDQDGTVSVVGAATVGGTLTTSAAFNMAGAMRNTGIQRVTTASAGTVNLAAATPICIHEAGSQVTTLTVNFPSTPADGQRQVFVSVSGSSGAITFANGTSTVSTINPLAANTGVEFIYVASQTKWYRIR
jgi:hypothetical protein